MTFAPDIDRPLTTWRRLRPDARLHARPPRTLLDVAYRTVDSPVGPLLLARTPAGPGPGRVRRAGPRRGAARRSPSEISPRVLRGTRTARRRRPRARRVLRRPADHVRRAARPAAAARLPPGRRRCTCPTSRTAAPRATRRWRTLRGQPAGGPRGRDGVRAQPVAASCCRATAWCARTARRGSTRAERTAKLTLLDLETRVGVAA